MSRTSEEDVFTTWDETELFCRTWKPAESSDRALILIHRGHEHSGRLQELVDALALPNYWAFSWDNRGHGHSPGDRGDAPSYYALVRDLDTFVRHVCSQHQLRMENVFIVANSVGAVSAAAWVHDYAPRIRGMALAAPAFRIRLYAPMAITCLRQYLRFKPGAVIRSYVKPKMLTHDLKQAQDYSADPLITRDISVKVLLGLHDTATRIIADAGGIETPTLVLTSGSDWVVKNAAHRRVYQRLSSAKRRLEYYPGFFHAVLFEKDRARPIADVRSFINECFQQEVNRDYLLQADRGGYTRTEFDLLRQPTSLPKRLWYGLQKLSTKTLGRLSDGVRIGWETGFDSGRSLDYVYDNEPRGRTKFGRLVDQLYLKAVGWRGIRQRRIHLADLLKKTIRQVTADGQKAQILDVAAGCGRYVLDALAELRELDVSAVLRDYEPKNLVQGRAHAQTLGLDNVVFDQGDAFNYDGLITVDPRPNIVIVSGLFELFPDNGPIQESLAGIAEVMQDGGWLIYTNQPWHPQVELIARTLDNREGKPWIMRRRTQAEMDELVLATGLTKQQMMIDEDGIFTVSVARKI